MSGSELAAAGISVLLLVVPVFVAALAIKRLASRRGLLIAALEEQGSVHTLDAPLRVVALLFGSGVVLAGVSLIPVAAWLIDRDGDAVQPGFGVVAIVVVLMLGAAGAAWLAGRIWVVTEDALLIRRFGREHRIGFAEVMELRERSTPTRGVEIQTVYGRLDVPGRLGGFDDLVSRLRAGAPDAGYVERNGGTSSVSAGDQRPRLSTSEPAEWAVPRERIRSIAWFLGGLLAFLVLWPWLVVEGDHYTRDSLAFVGVGLALWLVIAGLVALESLQRTQPATLEMRPGELAFKTLRGPWHTRPASELVSASVETTIGDVKGMPGRRHPLVLSFTDGSRVSIDQMRAKHMGTTTHALAAELHRRYFDATTYDVDSRTVADEWSRRADEAEAAGELASAVTALQHAVALHPDAERIANYRRTGDLQLQLGDHAAAVSSYRAHLDFAPDDGAAWEGLADALRLLKRHDLAAEAAHNANRLLLRR